MQLESIPPETARPARVVGVAASAGGVEALRRLVRPLPRELDAALCVVLHIPATGRSLLAPILDRATALDVRLAEHGALLEPGRVYVARADHHLLIRGDRIELSRGPKENGVRPAADPMFRSLAGAWGSAAVAVVLSGALDDGAAGALAIAQAGGHVIVQDPDDALVPSMPASALAVGAPHEVVPVAAMGALIAQLADTAITGRAEEEDVSTEPDPAEMELGPNRPDGPASGFTCPECSGALWELRDGELLRYRCRVGHSYSEDAMVDAQGTAVEAALWTALEVLEERSELLRRLAKRMEGQPRTQLRFSGGAREAEERAAVIRRILHSGSATTLVDEGVAGVSGVIEDPAFEALLEFLKRSRGLDFTGYKRPSLQRRFRRRMETVGTQSFGDYLDYLEVHPDEYEQLFEMLLINVTEFFRDPASWEHMRDSVIPDLLAAKGDDEPVRIWSAGCASGQEAYTTAMVFAELMGAEAFRDRVKIYATDIDEDALNQARLATYNAKETESVPAELRERYFERADQKLAFRKDLRRTVIFGRNNLVGDAPISRLDLLLCRNTLMYFNAETQARILRHFHFALRDGGVLMLGKSEMMISHRDLFAPDDLKKRIFVKLPRTTVSSRVGAFANGEGVGPADDDRLSRDAALELGPHAHLIVSRSGRLTFANLPARALFQISRDDLLKPFAELPLAQKPIALADPIEQAMRERRRVTVGEATFAPERGDARRLDVTVVPLLSTDNVAIGASVSFEDVTRYAALQTELEGNRRDLELAYEELQSTIDELETTNEELQSANEELQTTNEELQSTNEELETMNEELQSTNEELETINDELRERTGELNQVNDFLETILTSLGFGVAVLDSHQRVQVWNRRAEDLWGLRPDEAVDNHFLGLDIGLPSEQLAPALRAVLGGTSKREIRELKAVNRRGRTIVCAATVLPLVGPAPGNGARVRGAIVLMENRAAINDGTAESGAPRT